MEKMETNINNTPEEIFDNLYNATGYSKRGTDIENMMLHYYTGMDPDLMQFVEPSEHKKEFDLSEAEMETILSALLTSTAVGRLGVKSMMASLTSTVVPMKIEEDGEEISPEADELIQTRLKHVLEVSRYARLIAGPLGLNKNLAEAAGIGHDIGHSFNGHTGERIIESIAMIHNCGHFVHNAMGAAVFEREKIDKRVMTRLKSMFPNVNEEEAKRFLNYVVDGIVSHNGEGILGKITTQVKTEEQMYEEIRKCFIEKGYDKKIIPGSMEAAIIRFADIIAYMGSDILDGFRIKKENGEKILEDFDEDYLAIIGTLLARERLFQNGNDSFAKKILDFENKSLLEMHKLDNMISELIQKVKSFRGTSEELQDIKRELELRKAEKRAIMGAYQEFTKDIKVEYAKQYIEELKRTVGPNNVKKDVVAMMQNVFMKDLVETSKGKDSLTMSPLIRRTFFALRELNVRKIVPHTRRGYEFTVLPLAVNNLVEQVADSLLKTGLIYDYSSQKERSILTEEQVKYRRQLECDEKLNFEKKVYHHFDRFDQKMLADYYENAIEAVENIAELDLSYVLGEAQYTGELEELYYAKIIKLRKFLVDKGYDIDDLSGEERNQALQDIIDDRRQDMNSVFAHKLAAEYISGMSDRYMVHILLQKGLMSQKDFAKGNKRTSTIEDKGVKRLTQVFSGCEHMIEQDEGDNVLSL